MQEIVYHTNYRLEESYWWFIARNKIISRIINKTADLQPKSNVLDVGCGTGGFAEHISGKYNVLCLDTSPIALEYCKKRGLENRFLGVLSDFPKDKFKIDAVTMLDVIEHIEDDAAVIKEVYDLLEPGGTFIAAVPAYQWLWSEHDVIHMHYRRYTKKQIVSMFREAGFEVTFSSYYNFFLFPLAALKRIADKILKTKKKDTEPVEEVAPWLNSIFTKIFSAEAAFLPQIRFPFGVSIVLTAKKSLNKS